MKAKAVCRLVPPLSAAAASAALLLLGVWDGRHALFAATRASSECIELTGRHVPQAAIDLPTSGAVVTSATLVAASGTGVHATGQYCRVAGDILPVDPAAPPIKFQIEMPTPWNNKIMMFGGGGYDGTIPRTEGNVPAGPIDKPTPLERGYAVFGSDSGHEANPASALRSKAGSFDPTLRSKDGSFAMTDEALRNFAGDALKKTHDAALYLIDGYYRVAGPKHAFFAGGSSGGREALAVVQRWPQDWDGAIVLYPAWNAATLDLQFGRITRAFAAPGAYLNEAKRKVLYDAVLATCDTLDGVRDGLVSNIAACNATFDPSHATQNGVPLRCPGGADTGDTCLSDAQIAALKIYNSPMTLPYQLASGETQYPGFNVWGADLGMPGTHPAQSVVTALAMGTSQPANPMPVTAPYMSVFWDRWIRFFVERDPAANSLDVDPLNPSAALRSRISQLTAVQDDNKTDLSAFAKTGGKILMAHGMSDVLVSTRSTEQYYDRLQKTMGEAAVHNFVRYYEIPGYGHSVSTVFNAAWDSLTTLENWVEKGIAPPPQIVMDTAGVPGRTRPLCEYPMWPKYNGSGEVNAALSFTCVSR